MKHLLPTLLLLISISSSTTALKWIEDTQTHDEIFSFNYQPPSKPPSSSTPKHLRGGDSRDDKVDALIDEHTTYYTSWVELDEFKDDDLLTVSSLPGIDEQIEDRSSFSYHKPLVESSWGIAGTERTSEPYRTRNPTSTSLSFSSPPSNAPTSSLDNNNRSAVTTSIYQPKLNSINKDDWCLQDNSNGSNNRLVGECTCSNPLLPQGKTSSQSWMTQHYNNIALTQWYSAVLSSSQQQQELDVIFLGNSITEQRQGSNMGKVVDKYTPIKEDFDITFTKSKGGLFNGIALGLSGDTTTNLLYRLIHGELSIELQPKVWWISIGINDLLKDHCSEELIVLGIQRIVEEIITVQPNATVVINSILPVQTNKYGLLDEMEGCNRNACYNMYPHISSINNKLLQFTMENDNIEYVNANDVFVETGEDDGKEYMRMDWFQDPVHPNLMGFKRWNRLIMKKLFDIIDGTT
jgi:lysophospholipase L1-like esterase